MKAPTRRVVLITLALALVSAALLVKWQFDRELQRARIQAAHGSALLSTPCGPIEYQEAGAGVPLLAVHGSGGGHGQGMALAGASPDLSFWSALHISRDQLIKYVLATPSELLAHARARELARVHAILDNVLPVSPHAQGLRSDTALGKHLTPLQLHTMRLPTLVFSARDDRYDIYPSVEYTASQIPGAGFIGFAQGGPLLVGHNDEVMAAIVALLGSLARP